MTLAVDLGRKATKKREKKTIVIENSTLPGGKQEIDLYSFLACNDFCLLLITFANSLDLEHDRQNVDPDLDTNSLTLLFVLILMKRFLNSYVFIRYICWHCNKNFPRRPTEKAILCLNTDKHTWRASGSIYQHINVKRPAIVCILTCVSMVNFMFFWAYKGFCLKCGETQTCRDFRLLERIFIMLIDSKMPIIVNILTFVNMVNFKLEYVMNISLG